MSYTSNQVNSQSLNGIISLSDGVLNIEDGVISNIQLLQVIGNSELDGNLVVDGKITCAYTALLGSDVVNKAFVDDAFNTNSRFLKVDGSNQMNADLNMNNHSIYNVSALNSPQGYNLNLQLANANYLQLSTTSSTFSKFITFNFTTGTGINMNSNSITNLSNGVADGDGINKKQMNDADNLRLKLDGSTLMTGELNMGTKMVSNIGTEIPTSNQAVAKAHLTSVLGSYLPLAGGTMTGNINMNNNKIIACNSIAGNLNTNLVLNYLSGTTTILPKISLTSGKTIITDGLIIGNDWLDMSGHAIVNIPNGVADGDGINKKQMNDADNLRLKLDGSTPMTGDLNMNSFGINNVSILQAGTTISLKILAATIMQIQAAKVLMSMPIDMGSKLINGLANGTLSTDAATKGQLDTANLLKMDKLNGSGTGMMTLTNGSSQLKLLSTSGSSNLILQNSIASSSCLIDFWDSTSNVVASIQTGNASRVLYINAGTTQAMEFAQTYLKCKLPTQITGGLTMTSGGSSPIDMSGNTIKNLSNGVAALDATNKQQLDLKLNLDGSTPMTGALNMNSNSINNVPSLGAGTTISLKISSATIMQIQATQVLMSMPIDMNNNTITNTSNIHSFGTNPIYLTNNAVAKVKIDASGITMQNSGNIDMNGNNIINVKAPIILSTSSVYSSIDSNSQNVGYSAYFQNSTGGFLPTGTSVSLLGTFAGVPNSISIPSGVWIISASFTPYVSSTNTSNTTTIQLKVSNTTTPDELTGFPASNLHNLYNDSFGANALTRIVNTFVYTTTTSQTLYLWGNVIYVLGAWSYYRSELRATRIA